MDGRLHVAMEREKEAERKNKEHNPSTS
eukprot:SAG31_NODE_9732_length_1235_cov_2.771127_2_plen_27_part_01